MKILDPVTVTDSVLLASNVPESDAPLWDLNGVYGPGDRVVVADEHKVYQQLRGKQAAVTLSIATPCVVSWVAHGLNDGSALRFTTTGALPAPLAAGAVYYAVNCAADTFQVSATRGGAPIATTGSQSGAHTAVNNLQGMTPSLNPLYWTPIGTTNKWEMFDAYNNTQTENADRIAISLGRARICTGVYLGNIDATSVTVEVISAEGALVYSRTESMIQSISRSSFWNWCFQRIVRRNLFVVTGLPPFYNATINITINNPGGIAKCGMCCVGMVMDLGDAMYGLEMEIKDFSSVTFKSDGSSSTVVRDFIKRLSLPVSINNDRIDSVQDVLAAYRQRPVVWIGSTLWRWACIYGKFESFKTVIPGKLKSRMALTINGMV